MKFNIRETENILLLGLFLSMLGLLAAIVIAYMAKLTEEPIRQAAQQDTIRALARVLPAFDNEPDGDAVTVTRSDGSKLVFFRAFNNGKLVGIAGENSTPLGYGGMIKGIIGIEPDGKVRTVLITSHNETPGLGSAICERKELKTIFTVFRKPARPADSLPSNPILDQFAGESAGETEWKLARDGGQFDSVTGATVSCRAVTALTWDTVRAFELNREAIVNPPEKKR